MRRTLAFFSILPALLAAGACSKAPTGTLTLAKNKVAPGEPMIVQFTASDKLPGDAWVGIIPSNIPHGKESDNDANDLTYQYLSQKTAGSLDFVAPVQAGSYDFRMNSSDNDGKEIASATFTVDPALAPAQPAIRLNKTSFAPQEEITVAWSAPAAYPANAWVGIVPAATPHGSSDANGQAQLGMETCNNRTMGTWKASAPGEPGAYEVRMNDGVTGASETAVAPFTVK